MSNQRSLSLNFSPVYHPDYPDHKFLVMEQPKPTTAKEVLQELRKHDVRVVVRVCFENDYDYKQYFEENGIECHALPYQDGQNPDPTVIEGWLKLCAKNAEVNHKKNLSSPASSTGAGLSSIAIHCVAGLGRAPVLVAVAYIEHGMSGMEAAQMMRERRNRCLNPKQLDFLKTYKRTKSAGHCCIIL